MFSRPLTLPLTLPPPHLHPLAPEPAENLCIEELGKHPAITFPVDQDTLGVKNRLYADPHTPGYAQTYDHFSDHLIGQLEVCEI